MHAQLCVSFGLRCARVIYLLRVARPSDSDVEDSLARANNNNNKNTTTTTNNNNNNNNKNNNNNNIYAGRVVGVFYMLFAVSMFGYALSALADIPLSRRRHKLEQRVIQQYGSSLSPVELSNILRSSNPKAVDDSQLGSVGQAEFVVAMLLKLNKLQPEQVAMIEAQFYRLDVDRSGTLTLDDVTEHIPTFEDFESSSSDEDGNVV